MPDTVPLDLFRSDAATI